MEQNKELLPAQESRWNRSAVAKRIGALAVTASVITGAAWQYKQIHSGEKVVIEPNKQHHITIDQNIDVITWNMHNETASRTEDLKEMIDQNQPDAIALQEVAADDVDDIHAALPNWYISYVNSDIKDGLLVGGLGNAILTQQKPRSVTSTRIDGTSLVESAYGFVTGLAGDIAHADTDFDRAKRGIQANRSTVALTIKYYDGTEDKDLRIITSHPSGNSSVKRAQFDELVEFIGDDTEEGRPTIVCLDANASPEEIAPALNRIGYITGYNTKPTSTGKDFPIDHCGYTEKEKLGADKTQVLSRFVTDHSALKISFRAGESSTIMPRT